MTLRTLTALGLALTLCLTSGVALALDNPKASPKDTRIRSTDYDAADVIAVWTVAGITTHIVLADDEEYVTHAFGDALAYDFQQVGKHLLLKPVAQQADTNLIVITDKRNYAFLLQNAAPGKGKETHRISLNYPDSQEAMAAAHAAQAQVNQALGQTGIAINWQNYTMSGDQSLAPVNAWDDGAQTWLRFAPGQDLPAVYFVDADGNEVIANRHMADAHTIVMHRVAAKWHLRLGDQVLAIHNESSQQTRALPTRTISPDVERVLRTETSQ